jgi:splicing factor 3A subunit 1
MAAAATAPAPAPAPAPAAMEEDDAPESSRKAVGVIQPPPDMKSIVEKTAAFVAKNGPQFEQRILTNERNTTKFAFLQPGTPYYPYYQMKLREGRQGSAAAPAGPPPAYGGQQAAPPAEQGGADATASGEKKATATIESKASVQTKRKTKELKEPQADVYTVKPPEGLVIPSLDLDIIKLTAQYVALNGRSFLNGLLTRESRNPQFDFLKGHHYLFGYFTALVEAYSKVINPPLDTEQKLQKDAEDRADILVRAFEKLDWEAHLEKERQDKEDKIAREKETAAAIDWHDFKIVETIDFLDDEDADLPPPLSEAELRALRLQASTAQEQAGEAAADDAADMDMDEGGDMEMDEGVSAPSDVAPVQDAMSQFEVPAEADGPMKIVKGHMKPGEAEALGGKSAATGPPPPPSPLSLYYV